MSENYKAFLALDDEQYDNEYVILIKGKLVAHGSDLTEILQRVEEQYPHETPFIAKMQSDVLVI